MAKNPFRSGISWVALGLALHYGIAMIWTLLFYLASGYFTILHRRPVLCGLLYGVFVYLFMNLVALPLSSVPHSGNASTPASRISGVLAVLFCIGLTISLCSTAFQLRAKKQTRKSGRRKPGQRSRKCRVLLCHLSCGVLSVS